MRERETPAEARLPTKLRQKIQRRSEKVEMTTSNATNMNNTSPSTEPACPLQSGSLALLHVDLQHGLHVPPLLTAVPPVSSFVNVQALVPFHQALLPSAPPLQCVASLAPVTSPPPLPQLPKPERTAADDPSAACGTTQDRVERRLAQNREAARKCRQKKKAYLSRLEAEVHALKSKTPPHDTPLSSTSKDADQGAALQAPSGSHGSASDGAGSIDQRSNVDLGHLRSRLDRLVWEALQLRDALSAKAPEDIIRAQVGALVERLKALHKDKDKALRTAGLLLIMAGEHFHPPQRVLLWMGGLRPTEGLRLALEDLRAGQLPAGLQEQLQRIMEDCYQQEEALARAYVVLKADILSHLGNRARPPALQPWLSPHTNTGPKPPPLPTLSMLNNRNNGAGPTPPLAAPPAPAAAQPAATDASQLSPQLLGKLSVMRMLLGEAEDLRMSMLGELQKVLPLPQFALVLLRPYELLHALNTTSAALQALQADGRLVTVL